MSRLTRDGSAEPVSRDQIFRRERGQGKKNIFSCSADQKQDWQTYAVDPYSCYIDETIHTNNLRFIYTYEYSTIRGVLELGSVPFSYVLLYKVPYVSVYVVDRPAIDCGVFAIGSVSDRCNAESIKQVLHH